jgi:hypothetical protein
MPHWKSMMDRDYLFAFDLQGRDCTVTIAKVTGGEIKGTGGKKSKKPLCYFRESKDNRPLGLNSTNCKTIAAMYGNDTAGWIGKRITLYPTTTSFGSETVDCIRVRPGVPPEKVKSGELATAPPPDADPVSTEDRQPGEDDR